MLQVVKMDYLIWTNPFVKKNLSSSIILVKMGEATLGDYIYKMSISTSFKKEKKCGRQMYYIQ